MSSMTDEAFREAVRQNWKDHTKNPALVRDRLAAIRSLRLPDNQLIEVAALACHVYGEHLGDWAAGINYLQQLDQEHEQASMEARHRLARQTAILSLSRNPDHNLDRFMAMDRFYITVLAVPAVTLQRSAEEGQTLYARAIGLLGELNCAQSNRLFAIMTANLVCDLLERQELSASAKAFLIVLAEMSSSLWASIGDDSDREKAWFRLVQSYQLCRRPTGYGSGRYPRAVSVEP